jgi:ABC-type Zn uptake system ZnuABC Zn-binding protein ZnuA
MKLKLTLFGMVASMFLLVTACGPSAKKVQEAKDNLAQEKEEYAQEQKDSTEDYESYKLAYEAQIDANEVAMAELRKKLKKNKAKYEATNERLMDDLEARNSNMRKKIREFKREGKAEWTSFKEEFSYDMDELGKALKGIGENNKD